MHQVINRAWLYKDLKVSDSQANASLAQLVRHWTPEPVIISCIRSSPTGGNFCLAVVKSFDANTPISANFILTVKKLYYTEEPTVSRRRGKVFSNLQSRLTDSSWIHLILLIKLIQYKIGKTRMNCLLNNLTVVVYMTDRTERILLITCCTKIEVKFYI